MNTVHVDCSPCSSSVDNFVHILTKLSTLSGQYEHCSSRLFTLLLTCTVHVYCLLCSSSVDNFVHTLFKLSTLFCERVYYSHKILFTYLTESVDKIIHTFIRKEFTVHVKHCLRIWQKCGQTCPHFYHIVHTFIKLSTLSGDEFYCSRLKDRKSVV